MKTPLLPDYYGVVYKGTRPIGEAGGPCSVMVYENSGAKPLPPCNEIRNHSPDGFNWGYAGSGPAQLALAIMCHHTKDEGFAQRLYRAYMWDVISHISTDEWAITGPSVQRWLTKNAAWIIENER